MSEQDKPKTNLLRLAGFYNRTKGSGNDRRDFMLSNNIEKRVKNGSSSAEGIRLSIMNNDRNL